MKSEPLRIVGLCVLAAIIYGEIHDQITVRICVEYFSVFHPDIFYTTNPTFLAIGWGFVATWWMGAILGVLMAASARATDTPKVSAKELLGPISILLLFMAIGAIVAGWIGSSIHRWQPALGVVPLDNVEAGKFYTCFFAHNASYDVAFVGAMVINVWIIQKRKRLKASPTSNSVE